jgi:hypothetical protein
MAKIQKSHLTPIRCGQCAKRYPERTAPAMAEASGRSILTDVSGSAGKVRLPGFGIDEAGEWTVFPTSAELAPYAKVRSVSDGVVRRIQRDGPRWTREYVQGQILRQRPMLSADEAGRLADQYLADKRTCHSESRVSYVNAESTGRSVVLRCRACNARPSVNRRKLSLAVEQAEAKGQDLFVYPRGAITIGGPA